MLQPNKDRLDYGDLLMPPEGYLLENAIATTYSLDLDALVSIPVALFLAHSLEINMKDDFVQVLESIRRASSTVKVFCQKGQIKVPEKQNRLYAFIEPCVVQVPPTHYHSFHPKVWILRYTNLSKEIKYRVIVLSRNLTFDRSWDVAFSLDGEVPRKKRALKVHSNKPLINFVSYLTKQDDAPWYKQFIDDLYKAEFDLRPGPFESFEFLPLGIGEDQERLLSDKNQEDLLVISPFVTNGGLGTILRNASGKPTLLSREEELRKINLSTLQKFNAWHLDSGFVQAEERIEADTQENSSVQLQDLHAKVYCYKVGWDACLLLGSANCSDRAMRNNVEFMIKLKGKNSRVGPDQLKKELLNNDLNLFKEFVPDLLIESQVDDELQLQDQLLQRIKIDLVNAELTAEAQIQEDSNYQVELCLDLRCISVPVEIYGYLINNEDQRMLLEPGTINNWIVKNLKELDISSFLVIELSLPNTISSCNFALKVEITNLPETRNTRIFRDIISNTANFFKYIRLLLAENAWDDMALNTSTNGLANEADNSWLNTFSSEEAIYESMLKAASREPHKLSQLKEVIERLSQEDDSQQPIIPEDFKALWQVFESIERN